MSSFAVFKGSDKKFACLNPTLRLLVIKIAEDDKTIYVETAQTRTKLVLVHETDKWVLRKFNIRGEIAGRVLNNWELVANDITAEDIKPAVEYISGKRKAKSKHKR